MLPAPAVWAGSLLGCVTLIPILIGPIIVGVLVDYGGLSDTQAGVTAGYSAIGSVSAALVCALNMHRLPLRRLAIGGLLLAMIVNVLAALSLDHLSLFYGLRALAALGEGMAYAAVMSSFARYSDSERCYGLFMMLQFGIAGVALWALPTFAPTMSATTLYLGFAGVQLLVLPAAFSLPASAADTAGVSIRGSEWRLLLAVPAVAGLVALCFSEASNIGTDAYLERIAVHTGLSDAQIGRTLGLASILGMPGAFAILFLGGRLGHATPALIGFAIGSGSLIGILKADSYATFFLFVCIHSVAWAFVTPYIQSILADLDPGGAVVTAGGIASGLGAGLGPAATGAMVSANNYSGVMTTGLVAFAVAAIAILIAAFGLSGRTTATN
ncbi:MAG: MFS transporter [Pseudomonadota bacterium]